MKAKDVKKLISALMTDRKGRVSVRLGSCIGMDRIEINFPIGSYLSFNQINPILAKHNFKITQLIDFYYEGKQTILLIRYPKK